MAAAATKNRSRNGAKPKDEVKDVAAPQEAVQEAAEIVIDRIQAETLRVPIIGTSPLIIHRFSEKAKRKMLDEMMGRKSPKEPKDPDAEYEAAFYRLADGSPGIPVQSFKQALVSASRFYGRSVSMVALRQFVFFSGEIGDDGRALARIDGEPEKREDVVRVGRGGTDLRYRPQFREWSTKLDVTYVTSALTRNSLLSLIDAGGMGVGVGEWRPERDGDFGCFRIDPDSEVEVVR
jgi:hypothetical protein